VMLMSFRGVCCLFFGYKHSCPQFYKVYQYEFLNSIEHLFANENVIVKSTFTVR